MGYNALKVIKLVFPDREGCIVKLVSPPVKDFLRLTRLADAADKLDEDQAEREIRELFALVAKYLVAWNVEMPQDYLAEDSPLVPVPTTVEGLMTLDFEFALEIVFNWLDGIAGVPAPLGATSNGGVPALEGSIPMEVPSANR